MMAKRTTPGISWIAYDIQEAKNLLACNTHNRNLREPAIDLYARDMMAGHWRASGDTIKVSKDGVLLDGQHRLAAVIRAYEIYGLKTPVTMLTVTGLPPEVQDVVDAGIKRTTGDVIKLHGNSNSSLVASIARIIIKVDNRSIFNRAQTKQGVTTPEILQFHDENPEFQGFVDAYAWKIRRTKIAPSPFGAAFWYLWKVSVPHAELFLDTLVTLENLQSGSPILALSRKATDLLSTRSRLEAIEWMALIYRMWNAWIANDKIQYVRVVTKARNYNFSNFPVPRVPRGNEEHIKFDEGEDDDD